MTSMMAPVNAGYRREENRLANGCLEITIYAEDSMSGGDGIERVYDQWYVCPPGVDPNDPTPALLKTGVDPAQENESPESKLCRGIRNGIDALAAQYGAIANRLATRESVYNKLMSSDVSVAGMINLGEEAWAAFFPAAGLVAKTPGWELATGMSDGVLNMAKEGVDRDAVGFAQALLTAVVAVGSYTGQLSADIASKMSPWITGVEAAAFVARITVPVQVSMSETVEQDRLWRSELGAFRDSAVREMENHVQAMGAMGQVFQDNDCSRFGL